MPTNRTDDEGFVGPTVDLLAAAVGIGIVTYPLADGLLTVLGSGVPTPGAVTLVVALGGSYPFVAGPWSLGLLGDYVLVWTASVLGLGLAAFPVALLVGGFSGGSVAVVQTVLFGLAHGLAIVAVGVYDVAPTRRF